MVWESTGDLAEEEEEEEEAAATAFDLTFVSVGWGVSSLKREVRD